MSFRVCFLSDKKSWNFRTLFLFFFYFFFFEPEKCCSDGRWALCVLAIVEKAPSHTNSTTNKNCWC